MIHRLLVMHDSQMNNLSESTDDRFAVVLLDHGCMASSGGKYQIEWRQVASRQEASSSSHA
jgi:hypothetical protein